VISRTRQWLMTCSCDQSHTSHLSWHTDSLYTCDVIRLDVVHARARSNLVTVATVETDVVDDDDEVDKDDR